MSSHQTKRTRRTTTLALPSCKMICCKIMAAGFRLRLNKKCIPRFFGRIHSYHTLHEEVKLRGCHGWKPATRRPNKGILYTIVVASQCWCKTDQPIWWYVGTSTSSWGQLMLHYPWLAIPSRLKISPVDWRYGNTCFVSFCSRRKIMDMEGKNSCNANLTDRCACDPAKPSVVNKVH